MTPSLTLLFCSILSISSELLKISIGRSCSSNSWATFLLCMNSNFLRIRFRLTSTNLLKLSICVFSGVYTNSEILREWRELRNQKFRCTYLCRNGFLPCITKVGCSSSQHLLSSPWKCSYSSQFSDSFWYFPCHSQKQCFAKSSYRSGGGFWTQTCCVLIFFSYPDSYALKVPKRWKKGLTWFSIEREAIRL